MSTICAGRKNDAGTAGGTAVRDPADRIALGDRRSDPGTGKTCGDVQPVRLQPGRAGPGGPGGREQDLFRRDHPQPAALPAGRVCDDLPLPRKRRQRLYGPLGR